MKTVLLLGGYGFLGTNILKYIDDNLCDGYRAIVFDKYPVHPEGVTFGCVVRSYAGDFQDEVLLNRVLDENRVDLVIHAISTTIPTSSFNARYDIESNLIPTVALLNGLIRHDIRDIVYLSSGGAVYGNASAERHKESDDVFPISSYGVVKLAIEKYMMEYAQLYGLRPLILRLSNPYGPWHYSMKQGVCNVAMATALAGNTFSVWGDGTARKDYIYVEDFTKLLFRLLHADIHSQVVNIGSGQIASVNDILAHIKRLVPTFCWTNTDSSCYDVSHFELDTTKLQTLVGPFAFTELKEGLEKTYIWHRAYK